MKPSKVVLRNGLILLVLFELFLALVDLNKVCQLQLRNLKHLKTILLEAYLVELGMSLNLGGCGSNPVHYLIYPINFKKIS